MKRKPEAIEMLRRARAAGYANPDWIRRDPDLSCLHGEPERKPEGLLLVSTAERPQGLSYRRLQHPEVTDPV